MWGNKGTMNIELGFKLVQLPRFNLDMMCICLQTFLINVTCTFKVSFLNLGHYLKMQGLLVPDTDISENFLYMFITSCKSLVLDAFLVRNFLLFWKWNDIIILVLSVSTLYSYQFTVGSLKHLSKLHYYYFLSFLFCVLEHCCNCMYLHKLFV